MDAVVVESAVIERIADGLNNKRTGNEIATDVHGFVGELAGGLNK